MTDDVRPQEEAAARRRDLENRLKVGANWFYWIAGLSVINSVVAMMRGEGSFIIGLGVTQVVDAVAIGLAEEEPALATIATAVAVTINLALVGVCVLFGVVARKGSVPAFWIGMVLYALDGLIFLLVKDYLAIGFHAFALWAIYGGLRALNELRSIEETLPQVVPSGAISPE